MFRVEFTTMKKQAPQKPQNNIIYIYIYIYIYKLRYKLYILKLVYIN